MKVDWSDKVPTEPGFYWMYGITNTIKIEGRCSDPKVWLVHVRRIRDGSLMFITEGHFREVDIPGNVWAPAILPEPPTEVK